MRPAFLATPIDQPDPSRAGLVIEPTADTPVPWRFCVNCGREAGFGFRATSDEPGRWWCLEHRAEGQAWWRTQAR